jgi:hypothetical protein
LEQTYFLVFRLEANAFSDNIRSLMVFAPDQTVPASEPVAWDFANSFDSSAELAGVEFWIGRLAEGVFDEIRKVFAESPEKFDPRDYLKPAREAMKKVCVERMIAFGQAGWAPRIKPVSTERFASYYAMV